MRRIRAWTGVGWLAAALLAPSMVSAQSASPVAANTAQDFQREVLAASLTGSVVVMFDAAWCGPCRVLKPRLQEAIASAGLKLVIVDVDQNAEATAQYSVATLPRTIVFAGGRSLRTLSGAAAPDKLDAFLKGQ